MSNKRIFYFCSPQSSSLRFGLGSRRNYRFWSATSNWQAVTPPCCSSSGWFTHSHSRATPFTDGAPGPLPSFPAPFLLVQREAWEVKTFTCWARAPLEQPPLNVKRTHHQRIPVGDLWVICPLPLLSQNPLRTTLPSERAHFHPKWKNVTWFNLSKMQLWRSVALTLCDLYIYTSTSQLCQGKSDLSPFSTFIKQV